MSGAVRWIRKHDPIVRSTHRSLVAIKDALKPDIPDPAAPGPPPTIEDVDARRQDEADRLRRRRGRASAILTSGSTDVPLTASKTLLGA
jgi:hypothetical protein